MISDYEKLSVSSLALGSCVLLDGKKVDNFLVTIQKSFKLINNQS